MDYSQGVTLMKWNLKKNKFYSELQTHAGSMISRKVYLNLFHSNDLSPVRAVLPIATQQDCGF